MAKRKPDETNGIAEDNPNKKPKRWNQKSHEDWSVSDVHEFLIGQGVEEETATKFSGEERRLHTNTNVRECWL